MINVLTCILLSTLLLGCSSQPIDDLSISSLNALYVSESNELYLSQDLRFSIEYREAKMKKLLDKEMLLVTLSSSQNLWDSSIEYQAPFSPRVYFCDKKHELTRLRASGVYMHGKEIKNQFYDRDVVQDALANNPIKELYTYNIYLNTRDMHNVAPIDFSDLSPHMKSDGSFNKHLFRNFDLRNNNQNVCIHLESMRPSKLIPARVYTSNTVTITAEDIHNVLSNRISTGR